MSDSESGGTRPDASDQADVSDDETSRQGIQREVLDGLYAHMYPTESGEIDVRFYEQTEDGDTRTVHASTEKGDFYTKRQTRNEIKNQVVANTEAHYDDEVADTVSDLFTSLADAHEETEEAFRHPEVQDLLDNTDSVEVYGGETTTVELTLTWQGSTKEMVFTDGEWSSPSAHTFQQKFFNTFFQTPKLEKKHWHQLRENWEEQMEVRMEETQTAAELIAEDVTEKLSLQLNAYQDRQKLRDDKHSAWFDRENSAGRSEVPGNQDVVWVRSNAVREALKDAGKETGYMNQLSKALKQEGYTFGASTTISVGYEDGNKWQTKCYPFMPAAFGMTEHSIQDYDPEDDEDEDGEEGDGESTDDGSDDDDDSPHDDKEVVPDGGPGYGPQSHRRVDDIRAEGRQEERKLQKQSRAECPVCGWNPDLDEQPRDECARCENEYDLGEWQPRALTDGGRDRSESSTEVVRLNGAPGCGKTHTLFNYVEEERDSGREPSDILFCTFTRSGQAEAADEMAAVFPQQDAEAVRGRAKTVHGAALSAAIRNDGLVLPPNGNVMDAVVYDMQQDEHVYREFCEREGLSFTPEETNPLKMVRDGQDLDTTGNRLFAIYNWLKLERKPLRKFAQAPVGLSIRDTRVLELLEAWEDFKENHFESPRYEHVDYVDRCIDAEYVPDVRVLLIDEFQDLSPQEYLLFKTWRDSGLLDTIYIAGDQNQSLYSFRAGTPWYFRETPVDREEAVTESYRCPEDVVGVARHVLEACEETDPQGFTAKFDTGEVRRRSIDSTRELADDLVATLRDDDSDAETPVYLLARTNYYVGRLASALNEAGIPYRELSGKMDPWDSTLTAAYNVLRALDTGSNVPKPSLNTLLATNIAGWRQRKQTLNMLDGGLSGDFWRPETVWKAFEDCDSIRDIASLVDVSDYQREMLVEAVDGPVDTPPDRVKVGTIHASKGSEAPHVYLFNAMSKTVHDAYLQGDTRAEEHRVSYVGVTRASETLTIVDDFFATPYTLAGLDAADSAYSSGDGGDREVVV